MKFVCAVIISFLAFSGHGQCDSIPDLNKLIVKLAESKLKKKVGRGECWDLAQYVLNESGANWDRNMNFGKVLAKNECVMPGDIIQFEKVKVKFTNDEGTFTEAMPHHTAIVYAVKSKDEVELIHQNTSYTGMKVGISGLKFSTIISGKYTIYRPQR